MDHRFTLFYLIVSAIFSLIFTRRVRQDYQKIANPVNLVFPIPNYDYNSQNSAQDKQIPSSSPFQKHKAESNKKHHHHHQKNSSSRRQQSSKSPDLFAPAAWTTGRELIPDRGWLPVGGPESIQKPDVRDTQIVIPDNFNQFPEEKVTPHRHTWPVNTPKLCSSDNSVDLLVLVAGASWEFKRRHILRQTWAGTILQAMREKRVFMNGLKVRLAFYVGNSELEPSRIPESEVDENGVHKSERQVMDEVRQENDLYHDIIVENFAETYWNLTAKTIGQFRWAHHFCPVANYIMHVDSDVYVQWKPIFEHISDKNAKNKGAHPLQPTCLTKMYSTSKVKIGRGKYQKGLVDSDGQEITYDAATYPAYCEGSAFLMNAKLAYRVFLVSEITPVFALEDVYATGILRNKLDIMDPVTIKNGISVCQHLSNSKFHPGITYVSDIVEEKLVEAWARFSETSVWENIKL